MERTIQTVRALNQRRSALLWLGLGVTAAVCPLPEARAGASKWPQRTIRLLVAYPIGGVSDQVARDLSRQLSTQLSVQVLVENRPGAGGSIAMELLMRSAPDGHTLGFAAVTALRLAAQGRHGWRGADPSVCADRGPDQRQEPLPMQPPDPLHDGRQGPPMLALIPVAGVMHTPMLIAGTPALRAGSFAEMLRWAKARPEAMRWATTGEGTTGHTVLELVSRASGIKVVHVPYKGGGQQITDAIGGHFEVLSTNVAQPQLQAIAAGQLTALAVGTPQRLSALPDTPTLAELGVPQANLDSLFGVFAAPHTPAEIVRRIHEEVTRALRSSPLAGKLIAMSNVPFNGSSNDFEAEVVRRSKLNPPPSPHC